jgi:hypothetical protein
MGDPSDIRQATNKEHWKTMSPKLLTGNLLAIAKLNPNNRKVNAGNFIDAIAENLRKKIE